MERPLRIGVLALQGAFREHVAALSKLGADVVEVRLPEEFDGLDGLVVPGGESTTIMRLAELHGLDRAIRSFPGPIFGTCAGMIVLDRQHLDLVDLEVDRNAFGRQVKSSRPRIAAGDAHTVEGVFIGVPRIRAWERISRPGRARRRPGAVRDGRLAVASFHPEPTDHLRVHERSSRWSRRRAVSGHSKWSSIKHKKGAVDAKRGSSSRSSQRATMGRGERGGPDPHANLALQNAMYREGAFRTRCRRTTSSAPCEGLGCGCRTGSSYETVVYEGYGPDGSWSSSRR